MCEVESIELNQSTSSYMTVNKLITLVVFVFSCSMLFSQSEEDKMDSISYAPRVYTTVSIKGMDVISIDGILDEAAWNTVEWTTDYIEFQPDNGTAPSEQTKMKIVYDSKNIYVAFKCYQADPTTIERRLGRRDDFAGDWVEINIDSYNDDSTSFSFTASASGVKGDEFISNNGNFDTSWNPIWYLSTQIDADGWTAEFRIPLSQLRFSAADEQVWGLQSTRRYFNNEEKSTWQPLPPNPPGWVSEFGELRGINGILPQKQLEIQPYALGQLDTFEKEAGNPFRDGSTTRLTGGLDAKIGVTNDLTLDLTVNPDFGQVDADPGAIALDGFEIFFQERRPFFVENKNIFDFRIGGRDNLFFSRRIGRSPQGYTTTSEEQGEYVDFPTNTTILGAAKFSGKTKDGWSIGVLESVTAKELAEIELDDRQDVLDNLPTKGEAREELVEPLTNYLVGRVQKDFNDRNSRVGAIFTSAIRSMDDRVSFLHSHAYAAGLDFNHNWKDRKYYMNGNIVMSNVRGSAESILNTQTSLRHLFQRVDASHVAVDPTKTSLTGTGGGFEIGKGGGGDWRYGSFINFKSPELELNDLGFLRQADDIRQGAFIRKNFNKPTSWYRRANANAEITTSYDFEGNWNRIQYEIGGNINYKNNWWSDFGGAHKPRIFINTFLRGGPRWRFSEENFWYFFSGTDQRKKLSFSAGHVNSKAKQKNFGLNRYEIGLRYQPINSLSMNLDFEYAQNPNRTQYVTQSAFGDDTRYILGEIDNESLSATLRLNYSINPNLTIQYYGQPFIFRASYTNFNYVTDGTAEDINERVAWYGSNQISKDDESGNYLVDENEDGTTDYSFGDPDFAFVQFRSNLVVRWEYIPGSEIFFVWSQGITNSGDPSNNFGDIIDNQLMSEKPQNTFLVKATYRFVL